MDERLNRSSLWPLVVLAATGLWLAAVPEVAWSDGGLVPPYGKDVYEPAQAGLILYDEANGVEDLILRVEFEGEVKDFGWIVPVPSVPELEAVDRQVFWDCARLTAPLRRDRAEGWGCSDEGFYFEPARPDDGDNDVEIYSRETIGIFQTITVGADHPDILADSLETWGYLHEENRQEVEEALGVYIDKSWVFVAMRVDSTSSAYQWAGSYWVGAVDPIRLTFESDEIVYPLRISAISARDPSEILLYVCAEHRTTFRGAVAEYANRFTPSELGALRHTYETLGSLVTEPCFMTKLRKDFSLDEMNDDLILERAPNDDEFRQIQYVGVPTTGILFVAMLGILIAGSWRARRRRDLS